MASTNKRKRRRKQKQPVDAQKVKQRRQKSQTRALFKRIGFERHKVDGIEFNFEGRTGELDEIFIFENVVLISEYTVGKVGSSHAFKKKPLFDKIVASPEKWITEYSTKYPALLKSLENAGYTAADARVRIVYLSLEGVSEEVTKNAPDLYFLDGRTYRYFQALSKTIYKSARHESTSLPGMKYSSF
jgi:hypothetical protein